MEARDIDETGLVKASKLLTPKQGAGKPVERMHAQDRPSLNVTSKVPLAEHQDWHQRIIKTETSRGAANGGHARQEIQGFALPNPGNRLKMTSKKTF